MKYYSTNKNIEAVSLKEAVIKGLAEDKGLYMPEKIKPLPEEFFGQIQNMSFQEISHRAASNLFGEDMEEKELEKIVYETLSFDCPVIRLSKSINSLELFHGPTMAFKDIGARFMARMLGRLMNCGERKEINVLVATSGDTGSAVANGFYRVPGINVLVLYPKGKISQIQEKQITTLGGNIKALAIDGVFDDCQALVKTAFLDKSLKESKRLTSANSINVARLMPQTFYYFHAYAQMKKEGAEKNLVFSVPSGNFGNLTAGLLAKKMGLPAKRFIAANNSNAVFYKYLITGHLEPAASIATVANAMDVGNPSNFARIAELYNHSHAAIIKDISGASYSDKDIIKTIKEAMIKYNYICDPHGACALRALEEGLHPDENGVFLETAHPAKFKETVEQAIGQSLDLPPALSIAKNRESHFTLLSKNYSELRDYILSL